MTPAEGVVSLSESMCVADVMKKHPDLPFSRIPLESGGAGAPRFTGYALKDEILECIAADEHAKPLLELRRELTTVDQGTLLPTVFDQMVERREHLALVLDGQTVRGLITMEDVIETLLGLEIHDEVDDPETLHELARAHWRKRADRLAGLRGPRSPEPPLGITGKEPARRAVS